MTPLPQRKKTAEEIAKLRDQLGVPAGVESDQVEMARESRPQPPAQATPQPPAQAPSPDFEAALEPIEDFGFAKVISHEEREAQQAAAAAPATEPAPNSKLPARRRTAQELEEMRRREMLSQVNSEPPINIKFMAAHPLMITLGYLVAAAGVASFWVKAYPWPAIAGGCGSALLIAGFIALRRPVSRHHAGFIAAISVLVGVFTTIHNFPHLHHAS